MNCLHMLFYTHGNASEAYVHIELWMFLEVAILKITHQVLGYQLDGVEIPVREAISGEGENMVYLWIVWP